ncbi:GntP family permease [Halosimplex pelagicum]|uniref:GntP family permease n=1 Tax=Halosimplex pelagicum TaxID=869886 RepID=A0A7D5P3U5_9EURY|nr:gluconate:H+ symporter [Halosimplex pelagicum]QLH80226.1 GntP family permease [Halosimplex pelagicum]
MYPVLQLGGQGPLVSLLVGVIMVVLLLVVLEVPAFVGLIIASFAVGLVSPAIPLAEAVGQVAEAFGNGMAGIGIPILMAAIIGKAMTESGAANRVVRGFSSLFGEERTEISLFSSSFVMAIPVFFDNVFYLLAPIARSARSRTGRNYTLYIVAVAAGGVTTHGFIPPTPGPLLAVAEIGANLGTTMLVGVMVGLPTAIVAGPVYGHWINRRVDVPLRDAMGTTVDELQDIAETSVDELPGVFESVLPILLVIVLVGADTTVNTVYGEESDPAAITSFVGDPNFALTVAAVVAALTYFRMTDLGREGFSDELTEALKSGGNIAAITAAGGAFGVMLQAAGAGDYIAGGLEDIGLSLLLTAWLIAAGVRVVQGSATVAIVTTAGIMAPFAGDLAVNSAYMVMAIGAGASIFSWYNDSGFWIVKEIGGLTQEETLKTWTVVTTLISLVGIVVTLVWATVLPFS